ncbi:hypothetical protein GSI_10310 [Ganoderma sinense ZZ0214-1]|uniref:Uncharacterized protein n=1 Tax=Ganoderma sinense ZZ0214-1 TaxID=1077348 RepID=A0A2G8S0T6_9APHY|nr:hypothetical protein GSI_10310 [Ganoderma sinense ZZ0214-1]
MPATRMKAGHPIRRVVMQSLLDLLSVKRSKSEVRRFLRKPRRATKRSGTEYELLVKFEIGKPGLCAYEMRDVWRVGGEERYLEAIDEDGKPKYILPRGHRIRLLRVERVERGQATTALCAPQSESESEFESDSEGAESAPAKGLM